LLKIDDLSDVLQVVEDGEALPACAKQQSDFVDVKMISDDITNSQNQRPREIRIAKNPGQYEAGFSRAVICAHNSINSSPR
jgi:hypothetical protein